MGHPFREGVSVWVVGGRSPGFRADRSAPSRSKRFSDRRRKRRPAVASPVTVAGPRRTFTGFPDHRPGWASMVYDGQAMTVNLTRIYTRLGDGGETHLGDMSRVPKTHPRIEAYGTVDELNAQLGVALAPRRAARALRGLAAARSRTTSSTSAPTSRSPRAASASACASSPSRPRGSSRPATRPTPSCRALKSFVLPGGTPAAAQLHVCRTVCRRAERRTIACGDEVNAECVRYLNRPQRPAVHPLARGERRGGRRRAAVGAGTLPLSTSAPAAMASAPTTNVVFAAA